jgi:hypothetical protein
MYVGNFDIDDVLTFVVNTHAVVGDASDADSVPTYRVYEDETTTPILTGSMALLDGSNTVGLYSEQLTLSAANGFELGKCYTVYITATVGGITGTTLREFQMAAVSVDAAAIAAAVEVELMNAGTGGDFMQAIADKLAAEFDIEELTIIAIRDAILDRVLAGNHDIAGSTGAILQDTNAQAAQANNSSSLAADGVIEINGKLDPTRLDKIDGSQQTGEAVTLPDPVPSGWGAPDTVNIDVEETDITVTP